MEGRVFGWAEGGWWVGVGCCMGDGDLAGESGECCCGCCAVIALVDVDGGEECLGCGDDGRGWGVIGLFWGNLGERKTEGEGVGVLGWVVWDVWVGIDGVEVWVEEG